MPAAQSVWKVVTVSGLGLAIVGLVAVGLSARFEFLERLDEQIFLPAIAGTLIVGIGLIGWASQLGRRFRARAAALTLAPLPLVWMVGVLSNANIHDIFPLAFWASIPLFLAGIILGIMALAARRP